MTSPFWSAMEVEILEDSWGDASSTSRPSSGRPRAARAPLVATMVFCGVIVVALAFAVPWANGAHSAQGTSIVNDPALLLAAGSANADYFPFQATPAPSSTDGSGSGIANETVTGHVSVEGCHGACPSIQVEILTNAQLQSLLRGESSGGVWCAGSNGLCASSPDPSFTADVSSYSSSTLNLVIFSAAGTGSITLSVSANVYWTA